VDDELPVISWIAASLLVDRPLLDARDLLEVLVDDLRLDALERPADTPLPASVPAVGVVTGLVSVSPYPRRELDAPQLLEAL